MKFYDLGQQAATLIGGSAATVTLGAAPSGFRALAQAINDGAISVGDPTCFKIFDSSGNWEVGEFTITDSTTLTRTTVLDSSAGGTTAATFSGSVTALCTVPASYLTGQSLADYLASNPGGTVRGTDEIPAARGTDVVSLKAQDLATYSNSQWDQSKYKTVVVEDTNPRTMDATTFNRTRALFLAAAPIQAPSAYSSMGEGFDSEVLNLSGQDVTLMGFTVVPSGSVIPNGTLAQLLGLNGTPYAVVSVAAAAAGGTVPGQVTGLTAGTATDTTQPLSWTALSGATSYKIEYKLHTDSTWTVAATGISATSYTVTGLTASNSYDYRVTGVNGTGAGTPSAVVTNSTAAASGGGGANPFTATLNGTFPTTLGSGQNDPNYLWGHVAQATPGSGPTVSKVAGALSRSNTAHPDNTLSQTSTPEGNWIGNLNNYQGGDNWIVLDSASSASTDGSGSGKGGIAWAETARDYYYWMIVTDSNGQTWYFVSPSPINIGGSNGVTSGTGSTITMTPVA